MSRGNYWSLKITTLQNWKFFVTLKHEGHLLLFWFSIGTLIKTSNPHFYKVESDQIWTKRAYLLFFRDYHTCCCVVYSKVVYNLFQQEYPWFKWGASGILRKPYLSSHSCEEFPADFHLGSNGALHLDILFPMALSFYYRSQESILIFKT